MKIPVFVICRDRVKALRPLVKWFEKTKQAEIVLVNNDSTYPPLLEYLKSSKHSVHYLNSNHSKWAPWKEDLIERYPSETGHFAVCDPDVMLEGCPLDMLEYLVNALEDDRYSRYPVAGPSYEITDLPDHYAAKKDVILWEAQFWAKPLSGNFKTTDFFEAPIDSMFSVFRKGGVIDIENPGIRANYPYVVGHETWYMDSDNPSEEDVWYMERCDPSRAHWIREV